MCRFAPRRPSKPHVRIFKLLYVGQVSHGEQLEDGMIWGHSGSSDSVRSRNYLWELQEPGSCVAEIRRRHTKGI